MPGCWVRDIHGHKAIYPSSVGIYLNMELRDQVLSYLLDNNLIALDESTGERIPHTDLYKYGIYASILKDVGINGIRITTYIWIANGLTKVKDNPITPTCLE